MSGSAIDPNTIAYNVAHALARAVYLRFEVQGDHALKWPVAWTRSSCFIFAPPSEAMPVVRKDAIRNTLRQTNHKPLGIAFLRDRWNEMAHVGHVPTEDERRGSAFDPPRFTFFADVRVQGAPATC